MDTDVLIIGGGVTSLSLGNFLNKKNKDFLVCEKSSEPGGYCKTIHQDGFTWDYAGHFFHFNQPEIKEFATKNLECSLVSVSKISKIFYNSQYIDFPFQNNIHQLPKKEFIECLSDLLDATLSKSTKNSNFIEFVYSSLGRSIADKFIIPYNEKLYSCNLSDLDAGCMGRFFPSTDLNSLVASLKGSKSPSYNDKFIYPENGCYEFIKSIKKDIPENKVLLNTEVTDINLNLRTATTKTGTITFNKLVSSAPFDQFLSLCNIDSGVRFKHNKVVVFNLGFDLPSTTDSHWIYFPQEEVFYRVGFYDNILGTKQMSLYIEIGLSSDAPIDEEDLLSKTLNDLKGCGIIGAHKLLSHKMLVLNPAYVSITPESQKFYNDWSEQNNKLGFYSIGRYGSWTYCSIEDNIIQAQKLSDVL